jgi:hypothetical protein
MGREKKRRAGEYRTRGVKVKERNDRGKERQAGRIKDTWGKSETER